MKLYDISNGASRFYTKIIRHYGIGGSAEVFMADSDYISGFAINLCNRS